MKLTRLAQVSLVAVLLSACGGGGGSSGGTNVPTAAVQITQTNAAEVAKSANQTASGMANASSAATSNGYVGAVAKRARFTHSALEISLAKYKKLLGLNLTPGNSVVGVIQGLPFTEYCNGVDASNGTLTISVIDNGTQGVIDAGDVLTISSNHCDFGYGTVENGSISFSVSSQTGSTSSYPIVASFTVTFGNYSIYDQYTMVTDSMNGDITFSTTDNGTSTTGTMSGNSISMSNSIDGSFLLQNYSIIFTAANDGSSYSYSYSMTTASTVAGGSVTITTNTPFTGTTGNPTAGQMTIYGADSGGVACSGITNCGYLQMTANNDGLTVHIVVDDDGTNGPNAPVVLTDPNNGGGDFLWDDL